MFRRLVLATLLVVSVAGSATAGELGAFTDRARKWDFSLQTRYTGSTEFDGDFGSKVSLDDDLGWGFGFGYNLNERLNLGFLMSWRSVGYSASVTDANDLTQQQFYSSWLDTGTFAVSADWNILPKRFTPYVSGSLGWVMIDTNIAADYDTGCWWDPWWGYVCDTFVSTYGTDEACYGFGVGGRIEVSPTMFIKAGYEKNFINTDGLDGFDMFRLDIGAIY